MQLKVQLEVQLEIELKLELESNSMFRDSLFKRTVPFLRGEQYITFVRPSERHEIVAESTLEHFPAFHNRNAKRCTSKNVNRSGVDLIIIFSNFSIYMQPFKYCVQKDFVVT